MKRLALLLAALLWALPAYAGFVGVGANPATAGASSTNITLTAPTVQAADTNCVMVAVIEKENTNAISLSGWTNAESCGTSLNTQFLWKATVGTEGGTYNFGTWAATTVNYGQIMLFCGENTSAAVDQAGCNGPVTSGTAIATPSLTPTVADEDGIVTYDNINAGVSADPVGPVMFARSPNSNTRASVGFFISNASAQQFTLTSVNPDSAAFGAMVLLAPKANSTTWGIRSLSTNGTTSSTATFNAPVNIGTKNERIDLFLEVPNHNALSGLGAHWTCPDSVQYSAGTDTFWHCVDSAPSSSDTTYSFTLGSSVAWGGYMFDQVNTTATDASTLRATAAGTSSTTNTLTTANNSEPIFSAFKQQNVASNDNANPSGTILLQPALNNSALDFGWNISFERQATAGTSTARTAACQSSCNAGNTWANAAVANITSTPVPGGSGAVGGGGLYPYPTVGGPAGAK